jgi:Leucine-rich repeat (LRR) protein
MVIKVKYIDETIKYFLLFNDIFDCNKLNIVEIDCTYNNIKKIPKEINQLTNLLFFDCSHNSITHLPNEVCQIIKLQSFHCSNNNIKQIPKEINQLTNLLFFDCSHNSITHIPKEICQIVNLLIFNCSHNNIKYIPKEIGQLINLQSFYCSYNKIKDIPINIIKCRYLKKFYLHYNELEINPIIQRFINRIQYTDYFKIYLDGQNIHELSIQQSVRDSIMCLLNDNNIFNLTDDKIKKQIIENSNITCREQLFKYIDDKVEYSNLYCTFKDVFIKVYGRIINNKHVNELWKRLNKEMIESNCKDCTDRLLRLVNVLNGYYEDIKINTLDAN